MHSNSRSKMAPAVRSALYTRGRRSPGLPLARAQRVHIRSAFRELIGRRRGSRADPWRQSVPQNTRILTKSGPASALASPWIAVSSVRIRSSGRCSTGSPTETSCRGTLGVSRGCAYPRLMGRLPRGTTLTLVKHSRSARPRAGAPPRGHPGLRPQRRSEIPAIWFVERGDRLEGCSTRSVEAVRQAGVVAALRSP